MTFQVVGGARLRATLRAAGVSAQNLKDAHAAAQRTVLAAARPPRRSGALAASQRGAARATSAVLMAGSAAVPYAAPIHWGWRARHIAPQPWLSSAAQATEPVWAEEYERALAAILDAIATG